MYTNNPYAQGGWPNPQNPHSINGSPWCPNTLHPPTFGALPTAQTNTSSTTLSFTFSAFQPNVLNSVVTGPNNGDYFTIRTPTPTCTVIYKAGAPFSTITWENSPIVEAAGIINRQRTRDFLKIAADRSHRSMIVDGKMYNWIPRGSDVYLFSAGSNVPVQFARTSLSKDNKKVVLEITNEAFRAGLFEPCIISTVLLFSGRSIN